MSNENEPTRIITPSVAEEMAYAQVDTVKGMSDEDKYSLGTEQMEIPHMKAQEAGLDFINGREHSIEDQLDALRSIEGGELKLADLYERVGDRLSEDVAKVMGEEEKQWRDGTKHRDTLLDDDPSKSDEQVIHEAVVGAGIAYLRSLMHDRDTLISDQATSRSRVEREAA